MPVYKDKERGSWYFEFAKVIDGVRIKKKKRGFKTKSAASIAEYETLQKLINESKGNIYLYDMYDDYIAHTKSTLKASTLDAYRQFKANYLSQIPNKYVESLTVRDVAAARDYIWNKDLSEKFKNKMIGILRSFLNYGYSCYDLKKGLLIPVLEAYRDNDIKINEKKEEYLPPNKFNELLKCYDQSIDLEYHYYVVLNVFYWTGLRLGELCALNTSDVVLDAPYPYIDINKDYVRFSGKDIIQSPKTKNSIRKVYIDEGLVLLLKDYIKRFSCKPDSVLFGYDRAYFNHTQFRNTLYNALKQCGFDKKYMIKIHSLRHSHASYLRELGYDEYIISQRLGNTPIVASQTYIHSTLDEQYNLAATINRRNREE